MLRKLNQLLNPVIRYTTRFLWNRSTLSQPTYDITEAHYVIDIKGLPEKPVTNKPTESISTTTILRDYLSLAFSKENQPRILAATVFTLLNTGVNFLSPYAFGELIKLVQNNTENEDEDIDESAISFQIFCVVLAYTASQILPNIRQQLLNPVNANNTKKVLNAITKHQLEKNLSHHINTDTSQQIYFLQKGFTVSALGQPLLTKVLPALIECSIASTLLMYNYGLKVGLSATTLLGVFTAYCAKTTGPIISSRQAMQNSGREAFEAIIKSLSRYKTIHDFGKVDETLAFVDSAVTKAAIAEINLTNYPSQIAVGHILIARVSLLLSMFYFTSLLNDNLLSASQFLALFGYLNQLSSTLPAIGESLNTVFSSFPDLRYVFEELAKPAQIIDPYPEKKLSIGDAPSIEFVDISFRYNDKPLLLDQVSFVIEPGQTVAFVSKSGGGKSTIFNLLFRYYSAEAGMISIDNENIAEKSLTSLQDHIGLIGQNPNLFNGTIRENILFGAKDPEKITDDDILAIARDLNLESFLLDFPDGLNTNVGEDGKSLSGGQQQKVAIIRGFMKPAVIRLLDEVTAALDAGSANEILKGIFKLTSNTTTLIITHKLSEITDIDKIYVLDEGKIIAQGKHADLLNSCCLYRSLWEKQNKEVLPTGLLTKSLTSIIGAANSLPVSNTSEDKPNSRRSGKI